MRSDKKLLMISFFITNSKGLRKIESHWAKRDPAHSKSLGRSKRGTEAIKIEELGGSIALIDPDNLDEGFLGEIEIPVATGMFYDNTEECLLVGSYSCIKKVSERKIVGEISHPLFNDIHTLTSSFNDNLLVVSTGVDGILEIDLKNSGRITWDWLASEHGYDSTSDGRERRIDRDRDYRKITSATFDHSTHINSCLCLRQSKLLATLFHQGQLIEIDRDSGNNRVVLSGLKSPHHIRAWRDAFMLSDTRNGRVLLLDRDYNIVKAVKGDYNWLQDAVWFDDKILIGDSNNARLVKTDINGKKLNEFSWDKKKRKIGSFLLIKANKAAKIF